MEPGVTERETVSVVIPVFRREQYVLEAVDSVLGCDVDRARYEILVVAHGVSPELNARLVERGVSVIESDARAVGDMLATGVVQARGDVIAFLDDDDRFHPEKLRAIIEVFTDPKVVYFHHGFQRIDESGRALDTPPEFRSIYTRASLPVARTRLGYLRRMGGFYNTSSIAVRRSAILPELTSLRRVTNAQDFAILLLLGPPGDAIVDGTRVLVDFRAHVSQGTHLLHEDTLPADHLRFLEGTVRSFEWLTLAAPTASARRFAHCREQSYETLVWTMTGRTVSRSAHPRRRAVRAVLGNLREGDVRNAAILAFLLLLSIGSRRWALRFYLPLKRTELASLGFINPVALPRGLSSR